MRLPSSIEVTVRCDERRVPNILVWVSFRRGGHDYFRTHIGLTSTTGIASATGAEIEDSYRENQRLFPMDFKVPLAGCDNEMVVGIEGAQEFRARQSGALSSDLTSESAKQRWRAAENHLVDSATSTVVAPGNGSALRVTIDTRELD